MPEIAFIVEGHMEQRSVQRICPGKRVVRIITGGKSVTMAKMCEFIGTSYRLFGNKYYPVIVLFDREDRVETADVLRTSLLNEISAAGMDPKQFIVSIADRDIETWLLAHVDAAGVFQINGTIAATVDGRSGQPFIEASLKAAGVVYHKTTVGVDLLTSILPSIVAAKSESFKRFRDSLSPFCGWAKR